MRTLFWRSVNWMFEIRFAGPRFVGVIAAGKNKKKTNTKNTTKKPFNRPTLRGVTLITCPAFVTVGLKATGASCVYISIACERINAFAAAFAAAAAASAFAVFVGGVVSVLCLFL